MLSENSSPKYAGLTLRYVTLSEAVSEREDYTMVETVHYIKAEDAIMRKRYEIAFKRGKLRPVEYPKAKLIDMFIREYNAEIVQNEDY